MGAVEIFIDGDGALKVVQRYDLRPVLRRLRPEGFERPRVFRWPTCSVKWPTCSVEWPTCGCGLGDVEEAKFNRMLKVAFIIALYMGVVGLVLQKQLVARYWSWDYMIFRTWLFGYFEFGPTGVLFLAIFAAVLAVGALAWNATKNAGSAPPRREEVQTVSALVQQV